MKLTRVERLVPEIFRAAQDFSCVAANAKAADAEFFRQMRIRFHLSKDETLKLRYFTKHGRFEKGIRVGDTVLVKPARRRAKVLRRNPSMKGSVALDRFVDGFRCWHVKDLKLIRRK